MFYNGAGRAMWSNFPALGASWSTHEFMWSSYLSGLLPVDLENMPDDPENDNHSTMRSSLSPPHPASNSEMAAGTKTSRDSFSSNLLASGKLMEQKEQRPINGILPLPNVPAPPIAHSGEEDRIQEYLQRSDTAVIYPEPVGQIKDETANPENDAKTETNAETTRPEGDKQKETSESDYLLKCPHCERVFSGTDAIRDLKDHLASAHDTPSATCKAPEPAKSSHPCNKCSATFVDKESLAKHKLFHTATEQGQTSNSSTDDKCVLRKFKCPECGKAFKFKHHLKEHIRIHSGEKPFACQNCGKRFSHSGSYSSHMTSKKCLVVNLKVRKVDARSARGRGSSQNNSFRPIIPKYGAHNTAAVTTAGNSELPLVPAGYMPSSERFPAFLSSNRLPQSYVPLSLHPLLTSTSPYMPIGNYPEVTQLLQHRIETEATNVEEKAHAHTQMPPLSSAEKFEEHSELPPSSHRGLNAVKKILEIVDATVKQQNQQSQQPVEKTRNGLLSELLGTAPQTVAKSLPGGDVQPYDTRCKFCSQLFDNKAELHQHERYLCSLNSGLHNTKTGDSWQENNSDGESSKESSEEGKAKLSNTTILNGENLMTLKAHYQMNPRPKKSEVIRLSRDMKCPTRTVQAWFHSQQHESRDHMNGDSPGSPPALHPMPSSFSSVIPHYNGTLPTSTASLVSFKPPPALEPSQSIHSNYNSHETDNDQPLDLSLKPRREDSPVVAASSPPVESEALNLSQKSSRTASPPKETTYQSNRLQLNQIHDYQTRDTSPQPNLQSSLLYKYMQMGMSTSVRSPKHEASSFNPPLAAVAPASPERSPVHTEGPHTLPSPDAASCADNCSSPSGTGGSYGHADENNGDSFSPSGGKKLRIWHQGEADESTLDDSPGPEEDSSGGSGKVRKSWKLHKVESEEGMYACDQCDKMFSKQSSLARHKYEHSGQRPHKCDVCNKAFKHKHHLTEHKRLHSGEKPFQCKKCLKRFSHSGSYSQHMNHRYSYCKPYHE